MKLAEALILRADQKKRIEQLRARLNQNAKVQEGDTPAEDPNILLQELDQLAEAFQRLIQQINRTNSATPLEPGVTLADAIATRDVLSLKHKIYRDLAQNAGITQNRVTKSEVRFMSAVDIAALQRQADQLAKEYRELDTKIQALNWLTELVE